MKGRRSLPVGAYLALLLVLFVAAALGGVVYGSRTADRDALHEATLDTAFAAGQASESINSALSELAGQVGQLASTPGLSAVFSTGCSLSFAGVGPFTTGHLDVLRPDGSVACSSRASRETAEYREQAWLATAGDSPGFFGPVADSLTSRPVVGEVARIPGGGAVVGFVDLASLGPGLASLYGGPRHFEFLVTNADVSRSLSRSFDPARWSDVSLSGTPFKGAVSGADGHRGVDGRPRIYGHNPVSSTGWLVFVGVDRSAVLADADGLFHRELALILGSLAVIMIASVVVVRRITIPVNKLARAVRRRKDGTASGPIDVMGPKQLTAMAGEFNGLVFELESELARRQSAEQSYRLLFDGNPQPMWVYDRHSLRFLAVNDAAVGYYGYTRDEFLAMTIRDIRPPEDLARLEASFVGTPVLEHSGPWRHIKKDGTEIEVEVNSHALLFEGKECRFVMAIDITERLMYERDLRDRTLRDSLTGLATRGVVLDRLNDLVSTRRNSSVGVVLVDLDRFATVNDAHGREIGDELLRQVGQRLRALCGPADLVGRVGVDEFAIVCERGAGPLDIIAIGEHVEAAFRAPFDIHTKEIFVDLSVGVDVANDQRDGEEILRDASAALYRAKRAGGGRTEVFDPVIRANRLSKISTESELRRAVENGELRLFYQPEIELSTGDCVGAEALMRWQHPTRGLVPPADFIPIAEETGLIAGLGRWSFGEACRQAALWQRQPGMPPSVSVNLSARQLAQADLVTQVTEALDQTHLPANALCLELTETALVADPENAVAVLRALRDLGVQLSIDDFGTGYSSLIYLRRYPFQYLKIDREFVAGLDADTQDTAIVAGVVALGHSFDLVVVAEGVETAAQVTALQDIGCDVGQGYHWTPPLPPDQLPTILTPAEHHATTING